MAKVKKQDSRRHRIRNLPLKWSFMLYVIVCAVIAVTISMLAATWFSGLQSDIYYAYEAKYLSEHGLTEDAINGGMILDEDAILIYRTVDSMIMSTRDRNLYDFYHVMAMLSIPVLSLLSIVCTGLLFYNRKLKEPLQLIDKASARIAAGDLDFSIHYENRNEMGRLAKSFETMRSALQENHKEMWRMMDQRKQLNAAFAHDLRTPLTVLRGYTEYLKAYVPQRRVPEEKLLSTIDMMHSYIKRLEGYTTSMSTMQKLEEAQIYPQDITFGDLGNRLWSAADMLRGTNRLNFERHGEGTLFVDVNLAEQVLENLVSNAARYARGEIHVRVLREDKMLRLAVSDDGIGFSQKVLDKGIVPYNHRKDVDVDSEHYGLGLYICAVLCRQHGGNLALPSNAGESCVIASFCVSPGIL